MFCYSERSEESFFGILTNILHIRSGLTKNRHCEERSDEAIHEVARRSRVHYGPRLCKSDHFTSGQMRAG
jgi:uncharacterized RmlC-like cupin family protein